MQNNSRIRVEHILIWLLVIGLLVSGALWRIGTTATPEKLQQEINKIDQDPVHYSGNDAEKLLIPLDQQANMAQAFIKLYFSPWWNDEFDGKINMKVLQSMQTDINFYSHNKNYMFTYLPFNSIELNPIIANADLTGYPQINRPGITTHVIALRIFPTDLPNYNDPRKAGEGYPFDNWIATYLYPGDPIKILQRSKDQLWYFVRTSSAYGWIPIANAGFVDSVFMTEWQKYPFVVTNRDGALPGLRKGRIYPSPGGDADRVKVLLPYTDFQGNAHIETLSAHQNEVFHFPIPANSKNIAEMAKTFINEPYGWGGLYEFRDCSATVQDILAGFGIWLPRNSTQQSRLGKIIALPQNIRKKRQIIASEGAPYVSLVHSPGHVTLYIGAKDGNPYVEQDVWGYPTTDLLGRPGRAMVGKTIVSTLDVGKNFSNITRLQIQRAVSLNIHNSDRYYTDEQDIQKKVWNIPD